MSYKNNGPKDGGKKDYLVVNGSRVYTGEKFDASNEDVKILSEHFDIQGFKAENKNAVSKPKPKEEVKVPEVVVDTSEEDEYQFETEEDAINSTSFKTTNNDKGVK